MKVWQKFADVFGTAAATLMVAELIGWAKLPTVVDLLCPLIVAIAIGVELYARHHTKERFAYHG